MFGHSGVIINEHKLTAAQTRARVESLSRWFEFIHHDDLPDRLSRPKARPFCLMTFDDGKRSNATETAPQLERLGVPAVFNLTTKFLSDGMPLWFDRYAAVLKTLGAAPPGLEAGIVKLLPLEMLEERLDRVCRQHSIEVDLESDDVRPMTWDQARGLARKGFTLGAHGQRHSILTNETEERALKDIEESIQEVTSETGAQCQTFAYPNGNYNARLARHALRCGVRTVMTTEPTWVNNRFPLWRLPRVQFFGEVSRLKIDLKLAVAATGLVLTNPAGTGRLYKKVNRLNLHAVDPERQRLVRD